MDFYLNCVSSFDNKLELQSCSAHRMIVQALNLLVALFINNKEEDVSRKDKELLLKTKQGASSRKNSDGNRQALRTIELVLESIPATGTALLATLGSKNRQAEYVSQAPETDVICD